MALLSVVVPTYRGASSLGELLGRVRSALAGRPRVGPGGRRFAARPTECPVTDE